MTRPPDYKDPRLKAFRLNASEIRRLISNMGACFATDMIVVDGHLVGYMYRQKPDRPVDSGWRFLAGTESDAYLEDLNHTAIYDVNTIANYDPSIIPYLTAPVGSAFERLPDGTAFQRVPMPTDIDDDESS
jgi:hypothetical protein